MKFLRKLIHVDEDVYNRCKKGRDKALINIMALFTPVSVFIAGYAVYHCLNFFGIHKFIAIFFGVLVTVGFYQHDTTLLEEVKRQVIYFRLGVSFFLIFILLVPMKIEMIGIEKITADIRELTKQENNEINEAFIVEKSKIEQQEEALQAKVTKIGKAYDQTGNLQHLADARRELKAFQKKMDSKIETLETHYESMKKQPKTSKIDIAGYYFQNMFNSERGNDVYMNVLMLVLFLLSETLPIIMRVCLNDGEYMTIRETSNDFAIEADNNRNVIRQKMLNKANMTQLEELLDEFEYWQVFKEAEQNNFSSTDRLREMAKKVAQNEMPRPSQNGTNNHKINSNGVQSDDDVFPEIEYQ